MSEQQKYPSGGGATPFVPAIRRGGPAYQEAMRRANAVSDGNAPPAEDFDATHVWSPEKNLYVRREEVR